MSEQNAGTGSPDERPKSATMRDIADRVGVSKALVSLVFRGAAGPSPQTRTKVFEAAEALDYRPNKTASMLARRRTRLLGVMLSLRNAFHAELVEGIQESAAALGYDVVLNALTVTHDEREAIDTLRDFRCEALMLLGPNSPAGSLAALGEQLPLVVLGRRVRSTSVDVVRAADERGIGRVVDHLVGLGHRDIAHVDGGTGFIASDRRRGYRQAMRRQGLEEHIRLFGGDHTEDAGVSAAHQLLTGDRLPTAVAAVNDRSAIGLLDTLGRAGTAVPGTVSVAGYDDSALAQLRHIDLTSVNQNPQQQAEHAVRAVIERLDEGRTSARRIVLPPRLVVRTTTGAAAR